MESVHIYSYWWRLSSTDDITSALAICFMHLNLFLLFHSQCNGFHNCCFCKFQLLQTLLLHLTCMHCAIVSVEVEIYCMTQPMTYHYSTKSVGDISAFCINFCKSCLVKYVVIYACYFCIAPLCLDGDYITNADCYVTIEEKQLFASAYPDVVASFSTAKKPRSKKKGY